MEWSEYEIGKAIQLRQKGLTYLQISNEFMKDSKCQNRTREAIRMFFRVKYPKMIKGNITQPAAPKSSRILEFLKRYKSISLFELADLVDMSPKRTRAEVEKLIEEGKKIKLLEDGRIEFMPPESGTLLKLEPEEQERIKFAFIADTHIGSKYQQISALRDFYEQCARRGVRKVFHGGDWTAGKGIYRGQEYDLFLHSLKEQREYLIENYPQVDEIETIGIRGNHDEAWTVLVGDSIMDLVAAKRPDIRVIGEYQAFVDWAGFRFSLHHPDGGQAYAISYKLQKLVESFTAENLPDFVSMGHFHQKEYVTIRNVECFQPGC
ncbi:metallophosphoesterase family protein, partial [Kosmotoga pacifica]